MELSKKQKSFCQFFATFSKSISNFEHFEKKKMTLQAFVFPKVRTANDVVRSMSKKTRFRRPFEGEHCKWSKTPLKSEQQHVYHVYRSLWKKVSWKKSFLVIC